MPKTSSNIDGKVVGSNSAESQQTESVLTSMETSTLTETKTSMELCNAPEETAPLIDEPLNLSLKKADDQIVANAGTIDLSTGALDLSIRK